MMLKVLIVDDELLVRIGMKSMIPWEENGFRVVGDAGDGLQALEAIRKEEPDIVLTDIVMPEMNGIELVKRLKEQYPRIRTIMLSSHRDFEYVREAMKEGAADYVLKASLRPADFIQVLEQAAGSIRRERAVSAQPLVSSDEREQTRFALLALLADRDSGHEAAALPDEDERLSAFWAQHYLHVRVLFVRAHHVQERPDMKLSGRTLIHIIQQQLASASVDLGCRSDVFAYKENEWFCVVSAPDVPLADDALAGLAEGLIRAARRMSNMAVSVGVGSSSARRSAFAVTFREARDALQSSFYDGIGRCYAYSGPISSAASETLSLEEQRLIAEWLQSGNKEALLRWLEDVYERIGRRRPKVKQVKALYLEIAHLFKKEFGLLQLDWSAVVQPQPFYIDILQMESHELLGAWMRQFAANVTEQAEWQRKVLFREEILRLTEHLKKHYANPISLSEAARIANMSESHLSYTFKKETGKSFVEYVTDLRIGKAAELLRTTDWPNARIAETVGYENINYFGRAFKKVMGASPTQYKEIVKK